MIHPVSLLPFSAAVLSAVLAVIASARPLRPTRTARWFFLLNVAALFWLAATFIQLNWGEHADPALAPFGTWEHVVAWMMGLGVGGTTTYLFLFAAVSTGRPFWSSRLGIAVAHVPFLYTLVVGVTNPIHERFLTVTREGGLAGGVLAWPHYVMTIFLGIGAAWMLVSSALSARNTEGHRQAFMFGTAFAATIAGALILAFGPLAGAPTPINPVPIVFPLLSAVLGYEVLYHGLGDIVPLPTLVAIMDHAEMPLAYLNHDFHFVSVNSAFKRLSRHTESELIGRRYFDLFDDGGRRETFVRAGRTREAIEVREDPGMFPRSPKEPESYWDWTISPVTSADGRELRGFVLSLSDVTSAVHERRLSDLLTELENTIHSSLSESETLAAPIEQAAQAMGTDSASLLAVRDDSLWLLPCCGSGTSWEPFIEEDHPHLGITFDSGDVLDIEDASADDRLNPYVVKALGLRSLIAVPLQLGGETLGAIAFESRSRQVAFTDAQISFAKRFAAAVALALDNARRYESERNIAHTLQESMLSLPLNLPAVEFSNAYHSATEASRVGGDLYDLFALEDGRLGVLVGDVSGHGLEAAVLTSLLKNTVQAHAYENDSPSMVMEKVNKVFARQTAPETFATAFLGVLCPESGSLTYCSAGHPAAAIVRTEGRVEQLEVGSPLIGVIGDAEFTEAEQILLPGDLLVMYTDGVTEARRDGDFFGVERLLEVLQGQGRKPPEAVVAALYDAVRDYSRGQLRDDIALLTLRLSPVRLVGPQEPVLTTIGDSNSDVVRPRQ